MFVRIKKVLDRFLEVLVTVVMALLVIDVVWQVFTRYALKNPSTWTEELAIFLLIWVGMLGACVALNRGAHLGIDYFVSKLSEKKRFYAQLFVFTCIAIFSFSVMLIGGVKLVNIVYQRSQFSPALGLNMAYVYLAIPISGFFLVIYSVEFAVETILAIIKHEKHPQQISESAAEID